MGVLRLRATILAVLLLLAACAANSGPDGAGTATGNRAAEVQVTNNNWSDMVIYVVRGGSRFRLGRVSSLSTAEFKIPGALVGQDVRLTADPVGLERPFRTEPIRVSPGQRVEFTVQNHLSISHYSVWDI